MITGKQRAYLKGLAQTKKASLQFGKNGLTDTFISQVETNLKSEELVKIHVLKSALIDLRELYSELEERIENLEFVQAIGSKLTIYKKAKKPKIIL